jgi:hypothetical protein
MVFNLQACATSPHPTTPILDSEWFRMILIFPDPADSGSGQNFQIWLIPNPGKISGSAWFRIRAKFLDLADFESGQNSRSGWFWIRAKFPDLADFEFRQISGSGGFQNGFLNYTLCDNSAMLETSCAIHIVRHIFMASLSCFRVVWGGGGGAGHAFHEAQKQLRFHS